MAVIATQSVGYSVDPTASEWLRANPTINTRIQLLDQLGSLSRASVDGLRGLVADLRESHNAANSRVAMDNRAARTVMAQPADVVQANVDDAERLAVALKDASARLSDATTPSNLDKAALRSSVAYLPLIMNGPAKLVHVKTPPEDRQASEQAKGRVNIGEKTGTLKAVKRAAIPEEDYFALGVGRLKEKVAASKPRFSHGKSGPSVYWDFASLGDDDGRGVTTGVPNLEGFVIALGWDQIVEALREDVAKHYAGIEMVLTPAEKAERIATLSAEILELQRLDVELTIALRQRGVPVSFLPNTDPRALLGVDGPPLARDRIDPTTAQVGDF